MLLARTERSDHPGAVRLANAVGYLPLALGHAAAYCKHVGESFVAYAERLPELIRRAPQGSDYEKTVFATFSTACEAANALCKDASIIIAIVAFLAPDDIPVSLMGDTVLPRSSRDAALEALALLSLILVRAEADGAVLDVHRLVQAVTRTQLQAAGRTAEVMATVFDLLDKILPHEIWETEDAAASIFAAGEQVQRTHFHSPEESVQVLPPDEDLRLFLMFMRARRNEAGTEERKRYDRIIGRLFWLGATAEDYGVTIDPKHARAWRQWDQLLPHVLVFGAHAELVFGKSRCTSRLAGAMAAILYSQGRSYDMVERLLNHSISQAEILSASERPALAESLRNRAYFLTECKRSNEAEPLLLRALAVDVEARSAEHPGAIRDALRLAELLIDLKRLEDARAITSNIMDSVKTAFGDSTSWPRDVERAVGAILFAEYMRMIEDRNSEHEFQREVAQEFRRLKSTALRQKRLGTILYILGAALAVAALARLLDSALPLIYPLRWALDGYRAAVHWPLLNLNKFALPVWPIPPAVWDGVMLWIAFWLAANASLLRLEGKSVAGKLDAMCKDFGLSTTKRHSNCSPG